MTNNNYKNSHQEAQRALHLVISVSMHFQTEPYALILCLCREISATATCVLLKPNNLLLWLTLIWHGQVAECGWMMGPRENRFHLLYGRSAWSQTRKDDLLRLIFTFKGIFIARLMTRVCQKMPWKRRESQKKERKSKHRHLSETFVWRILGKTHSWHIIKEFKYVE